MKKIIYLWLTLLLYAPTLFGMKGLEETLPLGVPCTIRLPSLGGSSQLSSNKAPVYTETENAEPLSALESFPARLLSLLTSYLPSSDHLKLASSSSTLRNKAFPAVYRTLRIEAKKITEQNLKTPLSNITDLIVTNSPDTFKNLEPLQLLLLIKAFPNLVSLSLEGVGLTSNTLALVADLKAFPQLKSLNLSSNLLLGDEGIELLAQTQFAQKLEHLNVASTELTSMAIKTLSQPNAFPNLKSLVLSENEEIGDEGIDELIEAPFASTLRILVLDNTRITTAAAKKLSQQNIFKELKELDLSNNWIGDEGIYALSQAPFAENLESLNVDGTDITADGVRTLSQPNTFTALTTLDISGNEIGDAGISELVKAPFAEKLKYLNLASTDITVAGVQALCQPGIFTAIKSLSFKANKDIGDAGIAFLIKAPFASTLESLDLALTGITDEGALLLIKSKGLKALTSLNLSANKIGDMTVDALANSPLAKQLESLDLADTKVTTKGAKVLSQPDGFTRLRALNLMGTSIEDEGLATLKEAPFAQKLESLDTLIESIRLSRKSRAQTL